MLIAENIPLVLAAGALETIIGIIFFVIWIAGQLMSAAEKGKKEPAQRKRARPPQQPPENAPGGQPLAPQPVGQEAVLRQEVEDFLRRAQGKPSRQTTRQPSKTQPKRPSQPAPTLRQEGVAEHVAKHLSPQKLSSQKMVDHADRLGDQVAMADDRIEARIHEKFDRRLGALEQQKRPEEKRPPKTNIAAEVAAMLKDPQGMRQIIVAQEILRRPKF